MIRILVTNGLEQSAVEKLRNSGYDIVEKHYEVDELGDALKEFDILVVRSATKVRKPVIDRAVEHGRLKLIIRAGVGLDNIDVDYARQKGLKILNTPRASSVSVAELTIGHMLAAARYLDQSNLSIRSGKWEKKKYKGIEIYGKTIGLIGFGRIAREVALRAKAMGMKVIYYDLVGQDCECSEYEYRDFKDLIKESDFISLHCPYDHEKGAIIGEREIELMKDGVFIINCARGGLVCESALLKALESGKAAGACMDVYEEEPTPNLELVNHPRVSVSPHIGASTVEAQIRIGDEVVELITAAAV